MHIVKRTKSNQITLPRKLLRQAHLESENYFLVEEREGGLFLRPVQTEESLQKGDFDLLMKTLDRFRKEKGARRAKSLEEIDRYFKSIQG